MRRSRPGWGRDNDDEEEKNKIAYLAKKISKPWIRRKKKKGFVPKKDKKRKAKQNEIIWYEYKELEHFRSECSKLKKIFKKKAMMATWKDLDEEKEGDESQEKRETVTNLCFMADIVSDEEIEVMNYEPKPSYDDLQKAYDELLDNSQILSSHYASLKKTFQKLTLEFKTLRQRKRS